MLSSRIWRVVPISLQNFLGSLEDCSLAASDMMDSCEPNSLSKYFTDYSTSDFDFIETIETNNLLVINS